MSLWRATWLRIGSRLKTAVVVLFVGWQLFFLAIRNPLDFWYKPIKQWCQDAHIWPSVQRVLDPVDDTTRHYANFFGIDQNWRMFVPPLARSAPFLAARIEFTDGTSEVLRSDNEPNPLSYFRLGGWRQRKLEDSLVYKTPEELPGDEDLPLWEAYARWSVRRWRQRHPDDLRIPCASSCCAAKSRFQNLRRIPRSPRKPPSRPSASFIPTGALPHEWFARRPSAPEVCGDCYTISGRDQFTPSH